MWSLIARKWYLFRWLGARKFSSSGLFQSTSMTLAEGDKPRRKKRKTTNPIRYWKNERNIRMGEKIKQSLTNSMIMKNTFFAQRFDSTKQSFQIVVFLFWDTSDNFLRLVIDLRYAAIECCVCETLCEPPSSALSFFLPSSIWFLEAFGLRNLPIVLAVIDVLMADGGRYNTVREGCNQEKKAL